MDEMTAADIIELYEMQALSIEGGYVRRTWEDRNSNCILFLIQADNASGLHVLDGPEVWFYHGGAPTHMLLLHDDGHIEQPILGGDITGGHQVQIAVPGGVWMAAETLGDWSLLGTYMAPPYIDEDNVRFPGKREATNRFPQARRRLERLCRFP